MQNSIIWLVTACLQYATVGGITRKVHGMTASVRGQLGIAALLTAAGAASAAENLPLLRVDPALLGMGTPVAKPVTEAAAVVAPVKPAAVATTAATPAQAKTAQPTAPVAAATAATAATSQSASQKTDTPAPVAAPASPPQVTEQARLAPLYSAHVQAGQLPGPNGIKAVPHDPNAKAPIYITADNLTGTTDQTVVAQGNVELQQRDATLNADKVTYWQLDEETEAEGNVKLERPDGRITGPKMRMRIEESQGYFENPTYTIQRQIVVKQAGTQQALYKPLHPDMPDIYAPQKRTTTGTGTAERIDFEGEGQYRMKNASYSTCPAGDNQDWYAQVADLKLDYDREVGNGREAKVYFKGVPIMYTPSLSFSLNNQRKTGLLPATFGANSRVGVQYIQPFYWNIAPNMDATFSSRMMSRRGLQLNSQLRYVDYNYSGTSNFEYLPNDSVTGGSRYAYSILHNQNFGAGLTGGLNLNGVSDDTYFTDLSTRIAVISQGNLLRQGNLTYNAGWWSSSLTAQRYQTLQDLKNPITPPYARLPQVTLTALRPDLPYGAAFSLNGEYVSFSHPTNVIGQRTVLYPQLSLPMQTASMYVTPKIGIHATNYKLERQAAGVPDTISRQVPIFSVDSGVTFERDSSWFGRDMTQTLEPRLYYVYIPRRDQSKIPVFDTALADFNFAQVFSENRYIGSDRIGDANQLTAAVTSRFIDPNTGVELLRGMIGQRYYFSDQIVTLPTEVRRTGRDADLLASLSGLVAPKTYLDSGIQYNPRDGRTERLNLSARYQPEIGKVLNAGYRYTRDLLGQIDISAQWPLSGGWSGVGRYNYSTKEKRIIEGVAGFEYNAGCWAIRGVLQRLSTTVDTKTTSFFIQLELSGFSNLGSNPGEILRRNIPGYSRNYNDSTDSGTSYY